MQSVNINLVTHAFSCDIKEVLVRGYAEVGYSCITGSETKTMLCRIWICICCAFLPNCPLKILLSWLEFFETFARKSCHLRIKSVD